MTTVDGRKYYKSTRAGKKLMVYVNGEWVHFGDSSMQHYKDRTRIWSQLDHHDQSRRKNYLQRAKGIKNKKGEKTWTDPKSPNYHSIRVLW